MLAINIPRHKTKPLGRHTTVMGGCWVQSPLTFNPTLASSYDNIDNIEEPYDNIEEVANPTFC